MFDFNTLEKKCKIYHFKKYLLLGIPIMSLLAAGAYIFLLYNNEPQKEKPLVAKKHIKQKKVTIQKKAILQKSVIIKKETLKIEKKVNKKNKALKEISKITKVQENDKCYSLQFYVSTRSGIKYIHIKQKKLLQLGFDCFIYEGEKLLYLRCNRTKDYNEFLSSKKLANKYNLKFIAKKMVCSSKTTQLLHKKNTFIKPKIALKPSILTKENKFILQSKKYDLKKLKKLFQERKNYNIALKIARYYYEEKDYNNAIKWSKTANSINKTDDKSWIIYAKSLYAKKDYKKAKKILEIYTQFENSSKVTKLLSDWSNK